MNEGEVEGKESKVRVMSISKKMEKKKMEKKEKSVVEKF